MSPRRQKWTLRAIWTVVCVASGAGAATVKVGLGARAFAQEMILTTATAAVAPVEKRIMDHERDAALLRPVMLGWKDDMSKAMRRQDRMLLAICQANPRAKCVEADE